MRFVSTEDVQAQLDRVRESVASIVGRDSLEEFRAKAMPLDIPKNDGRSVT